MKRKYSDPLIYQAMMLTGSGIDVGDTSNEGTPTPPDDDWPVSASANGNRLSVNSQNVLQDTDKDLMIGESADAPPIVIDQSQAVGTESVIDILTAEETNSEAPSTAE